MELVETFTLSFMDTVVYFLYSISIGITSWGSILLPSTFDWISMKPSNIAILITRFHCASPISHFSHLFDIIVKFILLLGPEG